MRGADRLAASLREHRAEARALPHARDAAHRLPDRVRPRRARVARPRSRGARARSATSSACPPTRYGFDFGTISTAACADAGSWSFASTFATHACIAAPPVTRSCATTPLASVSRTSARTSRPTGTPAARSCAHASSATSAELVSTVGVVGDGGERRRGPPDGTHVRVRRGRARLHVGRRRSDRRRRRGDRARRRAALRRLTWREPFSCSSSFDTLPSAARSPPAPGATRLHGGSGCRGRRGPSCARRGVGGLALGRPARGRRVLIDRLGRLLRGRQVPRGRVARPLVLVRPELPVRVVVREQDLDRPVRTGVDTSSAATVSPGASRRAAGRAAP